MKKYEEQKNMVQRIWCKEYGAKNMVQRILMSKSINEQEY